MFKSLTILLILITLSALPLPSTAQRTVEISYDDGRASETVSVWTFEADGRMFYLRASDVARLFKATQFWNASSRKVVLGVGRSRFILTVDTRVVVIDGEPVMMRSAVRYDGGFVMVPLEFILDVASYYTARSFLWDEDRMTLKVQGVGYNVERIMFGTAETRSTVTIDLAEPLLYHMDANTPGLVRLKLYGGRIDVQVFDVKEPHGLIDGVRAEQTDRDAYIYFDVKKHTSRVHIDRNDKPHQIILVLEKGELPEIPESEFEGRKIVEIVDESSAERRSMEIKKIVLDPGHGGKNHGKVGHNGLLEKDANLMLAKVVSERLQEELGLEVILTRDDDRLLSLTQRTEIANEAQADLFISFHCNSWFGERAGGFEAYFLSPARSESERALARYENTAGGTAGDAAGDAPDNDIDFILWDLVQNEFINESSTFAEFIQKAMSERLEIRNRGVKQANFVVLQGSKMPAVLIETAFLSNPNEEGLLGDSDFHRRVADGMVDAVKKMQERYR